MKKSECYVGQRVEAVGSFGTYEPPKVRTGTIVQVGRSKSDEALSIGVEFDKEINGHNCGGNAKNGYGWYCRPTELQLTETETEKNEIKLTFDSIL